MAHVIWTTSALQDTEEIRDYIARDSSHYARLMVERIVGAVERLAEYPESGRVVPELRQPALREVIVGAYRVVYRIAGQKIEVAAVVHGTRRFPTEEFTSA